MVSVVFWLFMATPVMYFRLLHIDYGLMSVIAWLGLLGLIGGLALGLRSKRKGLLWFLVPFLLSHFYLVFHLGLISLLQALFSSEVFDYISVVFIVIEISILLTLLVRLKGVRIPAASLSVFCGAYTITAIGVAHM